MKVEDALRDYYDDRQEVRHYYLLFWGLLMIAFLLLALDAILYGTMAYLFSIFFLSMIYAKSKDGWHRGFWNWLVGIDGVATDRKRELLEQYRITDESDLEDLER